MQHRKFAVIIFFIVYCITSVLGANTAASDNSYASIWSDMRSFPESRSLLTAIFAHFAVEDTDDIGEDFIFDAFPDTNEGNVGLEKLDEAFTLLFASYLSEKSLDYLSASFECVPIASDALVFLNNAGNEVANMSQAQLQGIYTGEIANWNLIGGVDATIKAYQRPHYSDSQAMLEDMLLQERKRIPALEKWMYMCPEAADVVEGYDNGLYSLGYSRFFYLNNIFGRDQIQMITVDGIEPTPHTIATNQYPFSTHVYAVYSRELTPDHPVRKLVDWLLSVEGQELVENAGYIPIEKAKKNPTKIDNSPLPFTTESYGTGRRFSHSTDALEPLELHWGYRNAIPATSHGRGGWFSGRALSVTMPNNSSLEHDINAWCNESRENLTNIPEMATGEMEVRESANRFGNLLSLYFEAGYGKNTAIRTAVFDLNSGEQLKLSDLFLEGFNYIDYINTTVAQMILGNDTVFSGEFSCVEENLLQAFHGFPSDYPYFVITGNALHLAFQGGNDYFDVPITNPRMLLMEGISLWHDISPWGGCKVEISRLGKYTTGEGTDWPILFIPSLHIDDGQFPVTEQYINQQLWNICATDLDFSRYSDIPEISLDFGIIGQYLSVNFPDDYIEDYAALDLCGLIVDLHSGMPMFSMKQIMDFARLPTTQFLFQDTAQGNFSLADTTNPLLTSSKYSIRSMWMKEETNGVVLTVEMCSDLGEIIRMIVPLGGAYEFFPLN